MTEAATEQMLEGRWSNSLTKEEGFFKDCRKWAIWYIDAVDYEREIFFYDCNNIEFKNENMDTIWCTTGSGRITFLPRKVGVYIKEGTFGIYTENGTFKIGP
ncbi:hypothetical protein N7517_008204 [Penicillium concentricum]|uniref:Uncharacterized protein n=1 Tax=Penicillium concentricum TaxID=293559 RepID=A0A9W9V1G9_9EURO|nr:uncharacterized protein N7517_008204 [Penicillium concentricum]KAJ5365318.1 hypothetical protein N7517_008204 [Penicillium concentricum]